MKQKKPLNLNPFVLIFAVVVVAWLFTFIITPGTLVDGVYTALPKNAFNFNNVFNLFRAVPMGIKDTSNPGDPGAGDRRCAGDLQEYRRH